jgi:hypothetical protein
VNDDGQSQPPLFKLVRLPESFLSTYSASIIYIIYIITLPCLFTIQCQSCSSGGFHIGKVLPQKLKFKLNIYLIFFCRRTAMLPPPTHPDSDTDDEWEIIRENWWCTSVSGSGVSWTYPHPRSERLRSRVGGRKPGGYAKPMYYHRTLFRSSTEAGEEEKEDMDLNPALLGVRSAVGVLEVYEIDVGFYFASPVPDGEHDRWRPPLHANVEEDDVLWGQKQWHDLVQDLIQSSTSTHSMSTSNSTPSTPSFIDLSDSERSICSMPSTPKPKMSPVVDHIVVNGCDTFCSSPESSRKLSTLASPLVPSPSLHPPETISPSLTPKSVSNLSFPAHNLSPPVSTQTNDEWVFANGKGTSPKSPSSSCLQPPSSGRRRKSKTREIVDRLKAEPSRKTGGLDFKLEVDAQQDDGWIRHGGVVSLSDEKQAKARRSQELFLSLRQHQVESASISTGTDSASENSVSSVPSLKDSSCTSDSLHSKSPSPSNSNDGWISGPARPTQTANLIYNSAPKICPPVQPLVYPVFPVPVSYYAYPPDTYMHMQAQMPIPVAPYPPVYAATPLPISPFGSLGEDNINTSGVPVIHAPWPR